MTVLVDTSVWSLALRRRPEQLSAREREVVDAWWNLVVVGTAALIGPIRQEILSGVRSEVAFATLRNRLSDFRDLGVVTDDYDRAAQYFNLLRARGIAATPCDLLICAVARRAGVSVLTVDGDFARFSPHLPISLFRLPERTAH